MTSAPRTLFDKLWSSHLIVEREDGEALLWVDRHFVHEGSHHAFRKLSERGLPLAEPNLTYGVADHYVPTLGRPRITNPEIAGMVDNLTSNAARNGFRLFGLEHAEQGIVHVIGPELGLTLPGLLIVCGDSHTSTHGALGALAFGIGASEVAHVLMTQTIWQRKPRTLEIEVGGALTRHVTAKDLALHVIASIGADGARGHAIEYRGAAVSNLSIEARLTLCNMSIEAGARCALVAPDEKTLAYVEGRAFAPEGADLVSARIAWQALRSDPGARFDYRVRVDATVVEPMVSWGISPEQALPISARLPDPYDECEPSKRQALLDAIDYMGLQPGQRLTDVSIDRVFIGSCTNARIEDLRAAAAVLNGRKAKVPGLVSPGSSQVKRNAEREGLDRIFIEAGLTWAESGCSMCVGMNGDTVGRGERCASTTNRNFRGRQGPGARTHLLSPAMAAAAAVTGRLADIRDLG